MSRYMVDSNAPPAPHLLLLEIRAFVELATTFWMAPILNLAPAGDGHPVMVLPGLSAGDQSTVVLHTFLRSRGYRTHGWKLGRNFGRAGLEVRLQARLTELADRYGRKVSLVGWSLGGIYARELAHRSPEMVRCVIMLGSPFTDNPRANNVWRLYEHLSGRSADDRPGHQHRHEPPPVPSTAIYSRSDGIVAWQCCVEREGPLSESIEVEGSHSGLGHNVTVLCAVADRLRQPEGRWQAFDFGGFRNLLYRRPSDAPHTNR